MVFLFSIGFFQPSIEHWTPIIKEKLGIEPQPVEAKEENVTRTGINPILD